ncbi:MAG TPA: fluoride efflux transporter CrcB [Ramlibacter sp.]|nr:fluoride efflux transporter CrcB [Ramlibacter sp.]
MGSAALPLVPVFVLCAGASFGTLARWQLSLWLNSGGTWMPIGTLVANLVGGYLIGVLIGVFNAQPGIDPLWRLALITGFLGALTTFSTFSAETVQLLLQERFAQALALAGLHLVGSLALTWFGLRCAQWLMR